MPSLVRYEVSGRVAVITIDNPPVNALSLVVWLGLDEAVARAATDAGVDAVVLIGAGTTFIAGADIRVFDVLKTPADSLSRSGGTHALLKRVEDASKPLVAAIHGNALGGAVIESGKFDWSQGNRFPSMTDPEPAYHGLKFYENFGDFAFTTKARAVALRDFGPAMAPMKPRRPTGARSTMNTIEVVYSPPTDRPWIMRRRVSTIGAAMPSTS